MPKQTTSQNSLCTTCFKSLGVETKYQIYKYLRNQESATVTELTVFTGLKQPTVSHHLKNMENSGLLTSKRNGKEVYYSIQSECPHSHRECVLKEIKFN